MSHSAPLHNAQRCFGEGDTRCKSAPIVVGHEGVMFLKGSESVEHWGTLTSVEGNVLDMFELIQFCVLKLIYI